MSTHVFTIYSFWTAFVPMKRGGTLLQLELLLEYLQLLLAPLVCLLFIGLSITLLDMIIDID